MRPALPVYDSNYYKNEKELKLVMAFKILQEGGVSCRSLKCVDLEHLANIIRSHLKEISKMKIPNEKQ